MEMVEKSKIKVTHTSLGFIWLNKSIKLHKIICFHTHTFYKNHNTDYSQTGA